MTTRRSDGPDLRVVHPAPRERRVIVPNEVLATIIFIGTEGMLFAGFISAFTITRSGAAMWPPPGQPRLPLEATAINTAALLLSGALLWWAGRRFEGQGPRSARAPFTAALLLGVFFLAFQGWEWAQLLGEGLTLTGSTHGGFFYMIVGAHALHAIGGLTALASQWVWLRQETLTSAGFWAGRLFWYFVVLLWPILYWRVYV